MGLDKVGLSILSSALLAALSARCHIHLARTTPIYAEDAMHDDFHGPEWADQHQQVTTMIHKVFSKIAAVFICLNALQFEAPWQREADRQDCR
jgi:hypothetical protein